MAFFMVVHFCFILFRKSKQHLKATRLQSTLTSWLQGPSVIVRHLSFSFCGTDFSYNYVDVLSRLGNVTAELIELGVTVLSFGADGAGPFLKAILDGSQLFSKSVKKVMFQ